MKKTLETLLLDAQPEAKKVGYANFNDFWRDYVVGCGMTKLMIKQLEADRKPIHYIGTWEAIPFVIGITLRGILDGQRPLQIIGMTAAEELEFRNICTRVQARITEHLSGSGQKQTASKELYDKVCQLGQ